MPLFGSKEQPPYHVTIKGDHVEVKFLEIVEGRVAIPEAHRVFDPHEARILGETLVAFADAHSKNRRDDNDARRARPRRDK